MSSKQFTRQAILWTDQVNEDYDLPLGGIKIATYLRRCFNEDHGGVAWPSAKTIGDHIGLSERTVIRVLRKLEERGHLRIDWGKQGRGHSSQYWMILKPAPTRVLKPAKPARTAARKPASEVDKTGTAAPENHSKSHSSEAPMEPRRERESRVLAHADHPQRAAAPNGGRANATSSLGWPEQERKEACWRELSAMWKRPHLDVEEVAPEDIVAAARPWAEAYEPRFRKPLSIWLERRGWHHPPPERLPRRCRTKGASGERGGYRSNGSKPDTARIALLQNGFIEAPDGSFVWGGDQ
jgi:hypothetical protein